MDHGIKNRENLLNNDKNQSFLQKWERQSQRFGKKNILNLFQSAYSSLNLDATSEQFKQKFDSIIIKTLKKEKDIQFLKKKNYKEMMSLFGKFTYSMKTYGDQIFDVLGGNTNKETKNNNKETKNNNFKNISGNELIQPTLFDELSQDHSDDKKTMLQDIDLDILYARDPNELWWKR